MSIPGDARMSLAPWRCPHASRPDDARMPLRPGDARMPLAPWRCPHASRPGDARMPLAPWRCPHTSRPGDVRLPRALAMSGEATAYTTALLPRLASGKASTLLASLALACAKAYQFRLNSSLYVSGPTLQVMPGLCALSFCVGRCRGEKGMRRGGEQQQHYILAFPSIHEMSPVHWTDR
ncbi:hypothetical protein VNO80_06729 [Phaseolus coccineus]|uniref:Uncharacterized protein n=1 Tax=Phaseolus coccineus TaxID=3886 RepID=A0AAN9NM66_PHACN